MLRSFQMVSITGLLWLVWLVFSADSVVNQGGSSEWSQLSDRKMSTETGGSAMIDQRNAQNLRSLEDLRNELLGVQAQVEGMEFDHENSPEVVVAFLEGLRPEEMEILTRDLLEPTQDQEKQSLWIYLLMFQFGRVDPNGGMILSKELMTKADEATKYLEAYLFAGWSSVAPKKAWEEFENFKQSGKGSAEDAFLSEGIGSYILGNLAKTEPAMALEIVRASVAATRGSRISIENSISFESRDEIFKNLPEGMNWSEIAQATEENQFYPGQPAAFIVFHGPGPELFARWAEESPDEAIEWFTKSRAASELGLPFDNNWERLLDAWYERSPESSSSWVEVGMVVTGEEKYLDTLRYLLDSSKVEEPTILAARWLPGQDERFRILKLAAHPEDYEGNVPRDPFATAQNPMSQDIEFVEEMIPEFELSDSQIAEIRTIVRARKNKGD
jgi:hypothetical protein